MRLLPLFAALTLIFVGCSAGAGMQATPPAPISQNAGTTEYAASSRSTSNGTAEGAGADAADAAAEDPPISQSAGETNVPTAAGGTFLRA